MNSPGSSLILSCRELTKTYVQGSSPVEVLRGVNLDVESASAVAVVGSSGSGKSTLLHLLGGLDSASAGEVLVDGIPIGRISEKKRGRLRNRVLGFVYQFHHLLPEFSALENVAMPLLIRRTTSSDALEVAQRVLERVAMEHRLHHKPGELSGGERQRTAIARAMVTNPGCILADEPTGNLDQKNARNVFDLMIELRKEFQTSLVLVTHDTALAARADKVYRLENGVLLGA